MPAVLTENLPTLLITNAGLIQPTIVGANEVFGGGPFLEDAQMPTNRLLDQRPNDLVDQWRQCILGIVSEALDEVPPVLVIGGKLRKDVRRDTGPRNQREVALLVSRNEPGPPLIVLGRIPELWTLLLLLSKLLLLSCSQKLLEVRPMLQIPLSIRHQMSRLLRSLVLLHEVGDEALVVLVLRCYILKAESSNVVSDGSEARGVASWRIARRRLR